MTTEPTQPPIEVGPAQANGQEQSKGHRRRRRRRKNKGSQQGQAPVQSGQAQGQPQTQGQAPQQNQGGQQQPMGRPGRKKKKKFFKDRDRGSNGAAAPQPGNSIVPMQHGRRKDKQKGPRMFVGPMDHSYRVVNGNVADGPPSTINVSGNGHAGYYSEPYPVAAAPVRHDAPTRIFCFIDDLFFQAKINETSRKLGVKVEFVKGDKEVITKIIDSPDEQKPTLMVFDLNNLNAKPMSLIPKFKAKFKKATSIVGFLNHLQGDLKIKAIEAGCDTVMPRSAFSQSLPNLLRRYGLEEDDEHATQPM